jgi:AcrR family transcriptional regulator
MDDVASHLSISKKTLYKYVNDKDDLVGKVIDIQIEVLRSEMDCKCDTGLNAIEELLIVSKMINYKMKNMNPGTVYDLKKYYPEHYARLLNARREKMHSNIINNIRKGKEEGLYRNDLDENIIAKLQISRIENIIDSDFFSVEEFTSDKFFQEIFVYHIRGIANEKGIDFLENKLVSFDIEDLNNI